MNMRNTTINDDFLRRADMAKKDGTIPKHAVFAVPRATPEESDRKQEISSRDTRDRETSSRDSRNRRDRDSDRDRRSDRDRERKRSRSPKRDEYRSKNYQPPAINPHLNPRKHVEKPRGQGELNIGSFPHGAWNVNNAKSTNDDRHTTDWFYRNSRFRCMNAGFRVKRVIFGTFFVKTGHF